MPQKNLKNLARVKLLRISIEQNLSSSRLSVIEAKCSSKYRLIKKRDKLASKFWRCGCTSKEELAMKISTPDQDYIETARLLTEEEAERLHSRMSKKLTRQLKKEKFSTLEALAM